MNDIMANSLPLISIIVPVYNAAPYLPRCIGSILSQTHSNLELILINDGSTDESGNICEQYKQKDERVRVIHQENGGESAARNAGLDAASGEWFALVDNDDYIDSEMYEKLLGVALQEDTLMSVCGFVRFEFDNSKYYGIFPEIPRYMKNTDLLNLLGSGKDICAHWCMLMHRKLLKMNGILQYDTAFKVGGDVLFMIQAVLKVDSIAYIPEALYFYDCSRNDNTTNSSLGHTAPIGELHFSRLITLKKIVEVVEPVSPICAAHYQRLLVQDSFMFLKRAIKSGDIHSRALYNKFRREARGSMRTFLADSGISFKNKIFPCVSYFCPWLARRAWKIALVLFDKQENK